MKVINCLLLGILSYGYNLEACDQFDFDKTQENTQKHNQNSYLSDFLTQTKYLSPQEKFEFARKTPQKTDLEKEKKSAAHAALKNDFDVLFYLKVELDKALR